MGNILEVLKSLACLIGPSWHFLDVHTYEMDFVITRKNIQKHVFVFVSATGLFLSRL